jgi:hypothetical protein
MSASDGRDPKTGRFQEGVSGNRHGRPKGSRTVGSAMLKALNRKVPLQENGRKKRALKMDVATTQVANKAAQGDLRAVKLAFDVAERAEKQQAAEPAAPAELSASDQEIAERLVAKIRLMIRQEAEGERDGSDYAH